MAKKAKATEAKNPGNDTQQLAIRLRADRLARRLSWPAYAKYLGKSQTTIYKIASGQVDKAHELTIVDLNEKLDANDANDPITK